MLQTVRRKLAGTAYIASRVCYDSVELRQIHQVSLNIPAAESPSLRGTPGGMTSFVANPNFSSSTLSLTVPQPPPVRSAGHTRSKSAVLSRSLIQGGPSSFRPIVPPSIKEPAKNPDSSYVTAADRTRSPPGEDDSDDDNSDLDETCDDSAEVEDALQSGNEGGPTDRELELERRNELLQKQLEQVKLLVLGLDKRLNGREEVLSKTIERAEHENRGLDAKLREIDMNKA